MHCVSDTANLLIFINLNMQVYLTESVHDHTAQFNVQYYSCQWLSVCDPPPPFDNVARGGRYRRVNLPPPYFFSQFSFLPTFWSNFSLLPKLGLKIGGGQHTTPVLTRKVSFLTFRDSPLHQHTARRLRNHRLSCLRRFLRSKSPVRYSREFLVGVCRPDLQILTLFQTKKCRYSHPFWDLASKQ